jgi:cysteine desulfuration protein SufE
MDGSKSIQQTEQEIIEEFALFDSWDDKYEYIIDLGKKLAVLDDEYKTDNNKVKGCQSTVWLAAFYKNGIITFKADSDAVIVKGLISMLIRVLSDHSPEDILDAKLEFIQKIGMTSHLAQTRSNGLLSMVRQMKNYALAFMAKTEN